VSGIHPVILLVLVQRLAELAHARANTRRLLARGAVEVGAGHYPLLVLLHAGWWLSLAWAVPAETTPNAVPMALFGVLMLARVWVVLSLGAYWTTRIITLPAAPLVRRGPYRWLRHPNYCIVAGELALLPLAFDETAIAVLFSALDGALLAWRVAVEEAAIGGRGVTARGSSGAPG
jgi:methyltransferase